MILPDVNLLLYAHFTGFKEHAAARGWWATALNGNDEVLLAGPALFGFLRLATNPRVFDRPMSVDQAVGRTEEWLARPRVRFAVPGPRHLEVAFDLLRRLGAAANLTTDAQLAAMAIEEGAELHSHDGDFSRFPGLRWKDPLGRRKAR